jgi:Uma2 family endonuclease
MAGGTKNHSLIIANIIGEIRGHLKGKPCRVYDSNLRVRVPATFFYTYPDVTVICGPPQIDSSAGPAETVTNPRLIVEVVSQTSEGYDRGPKFDLYRAMESLQEYVLVTQDSARVETFYRQPGGSWLMTPISGLDKTVTMRSIEIELPLSEIYAGVEFPPATP